MSFVSGSTNHCSVPRYRERTSAVHASIADVRIGFARQCLFRFLEDDGWIHLLTPFWAVVLAGVLQESINASRNLRNRRPSLTFWPRWEFWKGLIFWLLPSTAFNLVLIEFAGDDVQESYGGVHILLCSLWLQELMCGVILLCQALRWRLSTCPVFPCRAAKCQSRRLVVHARRQKGSKFLALFILCNIAGAELVQKSALFPDPSSDEQSLYGDFFDGQYASRPCGHNAVSADGRLCEEGFRLERYEENFCAAEVLTTSTAGANDNHSISSSRCQPAPSSDLAVRRADQPRFEELRFRLCSVTGCNV